VIRHFQGGWWLTPIFSDTALRGGLAQPFLILILVMGERVDQPAIDARTIGRARVRAYTD